MHKPTAPYALHQHVWGLSAWHKLLGRRLFEGQSKDQA